MNDNQLYALILSTVNSQLPKFGIPQNTLQAQAYQPQRQGVTYAPAGYIYKLSDVRDGYQGNDYAYDTKNQVETYTTTQVYRSTFQINTLSVQNPGNTAQLTASDVASVMASILQNDITIQTFMAQNVGILNITDVRNPYFLDDRQRYEAAPSFDFTLTYTRVLTTTVPYATEVAIELLPVQ